MGIARRRMRRAGVVGAPVARTAATVGTAVVVAHGVRRRGTGGKTAGTTAEIEANRGRATVIT